MRSDNYQGRQRRQQRHLISCQALSDVRCLWRNRIALSVCITGRRIHCFHFELLREEGRRVSTYSTVAGAETETETTIMVDDLNRLRKDGMSNEEV